MRLKCAILEVDTSGWTVSRNGSQTVDINVSATPALCYLSGTSYLCLWQGYSLNYGRAALLTVNTSTWALSIGQTKSLAPEQISNPALCRVDDDSCLCVYEHEGGDGAGMTLDADLSEDSITRGDDYRYAEDATNAAPSVCKINDTDYLSAYTGDSNAGYAVIIRLGIKP